MIKGLFYQKSNNFAKALDLFQESLLEQGLPMEYQIIINEKIIEINLILWKNDQKYHL